MFQHVSSHITRMIIGTVVVAGAVAACDDTTAPDERFRATLTGAAERPTPVTTNAAGSATFDRHGARVEYTITFGGLSGSPTAAHIHGPATANQVASPLVTFTNLPAGTSGTATGTFTNTDAPGTVSLDSLFVLLRNGNAYINVHTQANQAGEIRGQITLD